MSNHHDETGATSAIAHCSGCSRATLALGPVTIKTEVEKKKKPTRAAIKLKPKAAARKPKPTTKKNETAKEKKTTAELWYKAMEKALVNVEYGSNIEILDSCDVAGNSVFLVHWKGFNETALMPADIAKVKCPQAVFAFYESRLQGHQ